MKSNKLCEQLVVSTSNPNVIAAGPLSHEPCSMPYRMVLVSYEDGSFSVHRELFNEMPGNGKVGKSSLSSGHYFKADQLVEATQKFAERVSSSAGNLSSLYRQTA